MIDADHAESDDLDAGLRVAFGRGHDVTAMRGGESVLERLGPWIGSGSPVHLRRERTEEDEALLADLAARGNDQSRYDILGEIARGGMGIIMRGRDRDLGRDVAIKVLQSRHADDPAMVRRFVEEAQIAGQLQHPGILQVYDLGLREDRRPFFTMKLIKGRTLSQLLAERAEPGDDRRRFLGIFESICQTVAYTHARGVVHRDLKPANIMVGHFGDVQVVDWGLAKLVGQADRPVSARPQPRDADGGETTIRTNRSDDPSSHSMSGAVMGTPAYMSPEQASGQLEELDERTDVFALGAMLCEILTGRPPYSGDGVQPLAAARAGRLGGVHARLSACEADEELIDLARACLAVAPADRPRDARIVADAVTSYLASVEERAGISEVEAAQARTRAIAERRARRLTLALTASVTSLLVLASIAFGWTMFDRARTAEKKLADSQDTTVTLEDAVGKLEAARTAAPYEQDSWMAVRWAGTHLQALQRTDLDADVRERTEAFLDELAAVDRDRRLIEQVEEIVIAHATHAERTNWLRMEDRMRAAFREHGIDLDTLAQEEIAARIRESNFAPQMTQALELWVATRWHLGGFGTGLIAATQRRDWLRTLNDADPDAYRRTIRGQVFSGQPDLTVLRELAASPQFDDALPRTQSWLGEAFAMAGDLDGMQDVYSRAIRRHSADFMLNFDFAYFLAGVGRWEEAIRWYTAAIAVRRENGGVWRSLGVAHKEQGDLVNAADALRESIRHQPDYAPTHVDLGDVLGAQGDRSAAIASYRTAVELDPNDALGHCGLGLALRAEGSLEEALGELELCDELGSSKPDWTHPSGQWLEECREALGRDST